MYSLSLLSQQFSEETVNLAVMFNPLQSQSSKGEESEAFFCLLVVAEEAGKLAGNQASNHQKSNLNKRCQCNNLLQKITDQIWCHLQILGMNEKHNQK